MARSRDRWAVVAGAVDETARLLKLGTRALAGDGDLPASRQWFEAAYREADRVGDATAMGVAVLGLSGLRVHEHRTAAASALLHARLRQALCRVQPQSALGLRLRARLAGEADYRVGTAATILSVLDETRRLDVVRRTECALARADALSLAHHCLLGPDHGELRRALADELIATSARTQRRSDLLMGLLWQTVDLILDADPLAERRLVELSDLLATEDHLAVGYLVRAIDVMLAIRRGRLDEAETLAQTCAEHGTRAGDIDATGWYGAQLVAIRWYQGRLAELLPMLTELTRSPTLSAVDNSHLAALAVAAATAGDRQIATSALARLRGGGLAKLPRSSSWLVTMYGIVEAAHLLGDAETAAGAYQLLSPYADLPVVAGLGVACFGSVHHALGVASLTTGEVDKAVDHLREAVHRNLALAHWPALIRSRLRYAEALHARGHPSDDEAAGRQLAAAAEEASTLGLPIPRDGTPRPAKLAAVCTRQGHRWQIGLGGRSATVEHRVGMYHLAVLIANPGTEIAAIDLVAGVNVLGAIDGGPMSAQPTLDRAAVHKYRQRLSELRDLIDELETRGAPDRLAQARAERDWVLAELTAGTGLGGRTRPFLDSRERARVAAGKAIRRALTRIRQADPVVGEHLSTYIHTGVHCSYRPH